MTATYGFSNIAGLDVFLARLLGVSIAFAALFMVQMRARRRHASPTTLATIISGITLIVSFGLFALILTRNPAVQWPIAFIVASVASLALGIFGYRRALKRRNSEL